MRYATPQYVRADLTPLVGVMLVLMTVFMAATPPATVTQNLDQPPMDFPVNSTPPALFVSIMGRDDIYIRDHKTSLASLDQDMAAQSQGRHYVLLRGDKNIAYGDFMSVLNRLKQEGYAVGLINEDME